MEALLLSVYKTNLNDVWIPLEKMEGHFLGKSEIMYCELLKVCVTKCSICLFMIFISGSSFLYLEKKIFCILDLPVVAAAVRRHNNPWYS